MANILINGIKSKIGGGKSILKSYLDSLYNTGKTRDSYYVLTPNKYDYAKYSCGFINIIDVKYIYGHNIMSLLLYYVVFPKIIRKYKIDLVFNFGDIIIPSKVPQIYLFDWAYAVYPNSVVWDRMDKLNYLTRRIKLSMFKRYVNNVNVMIAQTDVMKEKLMKLYKIGDIEVIPNAVYGNCFDNPQWDDFKLPKNKTKLLYLTYYSSHKNLEIVLPLGDRIKQLNLPYCIVITINPTQDKRAQKLINKISETGLDDTIINIGEVPINVIAALYEQCDGLFMPTLLESYGLPFIEAMSFRKTIFTSNLDFAKSVCGEAAFYFDPLDVDSILKSFTAAYSNPMEIELKKLEGTNKINNMLTQKEVFNKYQKIIERVKRSVI